LYTIEEFRGLLGEQLGDAFDDAQKEAIEALSHAFYFEEEVAEEDVAKLRSLNLFAMLQEELDRDVWDFGRIKAIFRALRLAPDIDSVESLTDAFESFLPFMKELALYLESLSNAQTESTIIDWKPLKERVLVEMSAGAAASVPTIMVWCLELFVREVLTMEPAELNQLANLGTLGNRQAYLIRGLNRDVNYFRRQKARFDERNNFEKCVFMLGASCLPKDEFENWVGAVRPNMNRPLDRLFCDWVKTKSGKLWEVLESRSALAKE
jgi:hypothetical protein